MKRLIAILALAISAAGCSTVTGNFLQRGGPKGPSEETVRAYIRQDDEAGARVWLMKIRPALPDAYIDELIVRAQQDVDRERARCEGKGDCAAAAAAKATPAPSPSPRAVLLVPPGPEGPAVPEALPPNEDSAAPPPPKE